MEKLISIVIPTLNRKDILKKTLLSLVSQTSKDFEVVIGDDGSTDGTGEMIKTLNVPFPIKHCWHENAGRSAARNMAIKKAEGKIILFIDDHIIADKRLVEEHIITHRKLKFTNIAVVRGRVEYMYHAEDAPKVTKYIRDADIKKFWGDQNPVIIFITNNISVRKDAIQKAGGFDEDFKEYGYQDQELGYRIRRAGFRFRYNPNAVGYIFSLGLAEKDLYNKCRQAGRSAVIFFRKHPVFAFFNVGVNPINTLLYLIFSLNNNWWLRRAAAKLAKAKGKKDERKIKLYDGRIRFFYFILGVHEKYYGRKIELPEGIL